MPQFLVRLLTTETEGRELDALVFPSARGGGYLTLGQARYGFGGGRRLPWGPTTRSAPHVRVVGDQRGPNVKVVQKLLGHKTAVLTLDRYGHLFPDDLDAVAVAFDTLAATTADALRTAGSQNAKQPPSKGG